MKVIYICDQTEEWATMTNLFKAHFKKVELKCVITGAEALELLTLDGFFSLILIEASIRHENPSQLADRLTEAIGERPFIFVGERVHIVDRIDSDLYSKSSHNDILIRPFAVASFIDAVSKAISWVEEEEFENSIEELDRNGLLPMKIRCFYMFDILPYDVYLELTQTKFARILAANQQYTQADIQVYARRRVKNLYLRKNEFLKFLEDAFKKVSLVFENNKKYSPQKLMANQIRSVLLIHQYVSHLGPSPDITKICELFIDVTKDVFHHFSTFREIIVNFPVKKMEIPEQSVLTSYLCESILVSLGWASNTSRLKLGLASILYDCMIPSDELALVYDKEDNLLSKLSPEELQNFYQHPLKSAAIATHFQGFPDTDFIISQHHERPSGVGFPQKLGINKLTTHSCTFILATAFVQRMACNDIHKKGVLQNIYTEIKEIYNVGNFKAPLMAIGKMID